MTKFLSLICFLLLTGTLSAQKLKKEFKLLFYFNKKRLIPIFKPYIKQKNTSLPFVPL